MRYLLYPGEDGVKPVAIYTQCEDELLARAELMVLLDRARRDYPDAPILGSYDHGPDCLKEDKFKQAYRGRADAYKSLMEKRSWILENGWPYKEVEGEGDDLAGHTEAGQMLINGANGDRIISYMREVPTPTDIDSGDIGLYLIEKWTLFDQLLAKHQEVNGVWIGFPEVLGDNYLELLINLGKLAERGLTLHVIKPSPWLRTIGMEEMSDEL